MPIYEYKCAACNSKFEKMRPFSQSAEDAACPHCQQPSKRILSTFCSFNKGEGGVTTPTGGSSCSGCSAGSCASCGH